MSRSLPLLRLLRGLLAGLLLAAPPALHAWDAARLEQAAQQRGPRAREPVRALLALLDEAALLDPAARLQAVNRFVNQRVRYREDMDLWGKSDQWVSPLETLALGEGDCEDYAIAKYFILLAHGMPVSQLRLVYVRAQMGTAAVATQAHMVLAWYPQPAAEPLILDNLVPEVRPASRRPDLTPVFSFNSEGLWQGVAGPSAGDPLLRLSRWREVVAKARAEGFP